MCKKNFFSVVLCAIFIMVGFGNVTKNSFICEAYATEYKNVGQVRDLLTDREWIYNATEQYKNNNGYFSGTPMFFVQDINDDGNLEIYVRSNDSRCHAETVDYLITFVNGEPKVTICSGDEFYGYNENEGVLVSGYCGMGCELIEILEVKNDGSVSTRHNLNNGCCATPLYDEDFHHINADGYVRWIQIDDGQKIYVDSEEEYMKNLNGILNYYNLKVPEMFPFYSNYNEVALSAVYSENNEENNEYKQDKMEYLWKNSENYSYSEILNYPENYRGKIGCFTGEVVEVIEIGNDETNYKVNITRTDNGWKDTIYVKEKGGNLSRGYQLVKGDWVMMFGEMQGLTLEQSVTGEYIFMPLVNSIEMFWDE